MLFTVLAFSSLAGFIKATCLDFPMQECLYIFGLSAFSIVMFILIMKDESASFLILKAITISTLIITFYGIYQYVSGFENTREYVTDLLSKKDILLPEEVKIRLSNNFIFSTFTISNSFAAHLILTAPVCIYMLFYPNFLKNKMIHYISVSVTVLLILTALLLSGSRGAILSFASAVVILFILLNMKNKKSIFIASFALLITTIIIFLVPKDSGSIFIRLDYFQAGIVLLKNNLFTGAGWGEFFHSYTYLKKFLTPEAPHDPHNFIISMGSQAGITAAITALLIIVVPISLVLKKLNKFSLREKFKTLEFPILLGITAWYIHSFMDINFQIPGTTATAIILLIIMTKSDDQFSYKKFFPIILRTIFLLIALAVIIPGIYRFRSEYYISKLSNICYPQFSSEKSTNVSTKEAEKLLKTTVKAAPYSPFPWAIFGDYAKSNNMNKQAELCFTNAIRLSPGRANLYYNLAIIRLGNREKGYAIENMGMAAKLFPYKYSILYNKMKENYYKGL